MVLSTFVTITVTLIVLLLISLALLDLNRKIGSGILAQTLASWYMHWRKNQGGWGASAPLVQNIGGLSPPCESVKVNCAGIYI